MYSVYIPVYILNVHYFFLLNIIFNAVDNIYKYKIIYTCTYLYSILYQQFLIIRKVILLMVIFCSFGYFGEKQFLILKK